MTWQTYSQTDRMHYLHRIRELFSSRSSRQQLLYRLQHRYQYRLSRILWMGKLLLLAIPLTLQAVNLVKEWKRFRTLIQ